MAFMGHVGMITNVARALSGIASIEGVTSYRHSPIFLACGTCLDVVAREISIPSSPRAESLS